MDNKNGFRKILSIFLFLIILLNSIYPVIGASWEKESQLTLNDVSQHLDVREEPISNSFTSNLFAPFSGTEGDVLIQVKRDNNELLPNVAEWDFYTDTKLSIAISITVRQNTISGQHSVVLYAPDGMDFSIGTGEIPGILSYELTENNTKLTYVLKGTTVSDETVNIIDTSFQLKAKGLDTQDTSYNAKAIRIYKNLFITNNGRPTFPIEWEYVHEGGITNNGECVLIPKVFGNGEVDPFNKFGFIYGTNTSNPFTTSSYIYNNLNIGATKDASDKYPFYLNGYTALTTDTSYSRVVLNQKTGSTDPVWGISAKLYLPPEIKCTDSTNTRTDAEGTYIQIGGNGLSSIEGIYNSNSTSNLYTVFSLADNKSLRFTLADGIDPATLTWPNTNTKLVINYTTIDTNGNAVERNQTITEALKFDYKPLLNVDWYSISAPSSRSSGFILSTDILADTDRYISFKAVNYDVQQHINENHKDGTLTFTNEGGYFIDYITYPSAALNTVSIVYYKSDDPTTAIPITPTGTSSHNLTFSGQTPISYVNKIVFTFTDGHAQDIATSFNFGMHGFTGLTPNTADTNYYYSKIVTELKAWNGCGNGAVDTTNSTTPPINNNKHTYELPVKVSLTVQDTLTAVVLGSIKQLYGSSYNPNSTSDHINIMMGYDTRNASGIYTYDQNARIAYNNFRVDFGTQNPYNPTELNGKDSSLLMLQKIEGIITVNSNARYTNGKFYYTTNKNPSVQVLNVGNSGNPLDLTVNGTTRQVTLNLNEEEYITSLTFIADKFAIANYTNVTNLSPDTSPGLVYAKAGVYAYPDVTYWTSSNKVFTLPTNNQRVFADGEPVVHGQVYNFFISMQADNMNNGSSSRQSHVYPYGTSSKTNSLSHALYQEQTPFTIASDSVSGSIIEGNSFEYIIKRSFPYGGILTDAHIWLEIDSRFAYISNNIGARVIQKEVAGKTYLCIERPGNVLRDGTSSTDFTLDTIKIKLKALTSTNGYEAPLKAAWVDYSKTMSIIEELKNESPYVIPRTTPAKDNTAPPLNETFTGSNQYLVKTTGGFGTILVNTGLSTGAEFVPKAGTALGQRDGTSANIIVPMRPLEADELALNVIINSGTTTGINKNEFYAELSIPSLPNSVEIDGEYNHFLLYPTGIPKLNFSSVDVTGNITIKYVDSLDNEYLAADYPTNKYHEIKKIIITAVDLPQTSISLDIPIKADFTTWHTGDTAGIKCVSTIGADSLVSINANTLWLMESTAQNSISGYAFKDYLYTSNFIGSNAAYKDIKVDLYKATSPNVSIASVLTDAQGKYSFSNLEDGDYLVGVTLPIPYNNTTGGYKISPDIIDTNTGNNMSTFGKTAPIRLENYAIIEGFNIGIQYHGVMEVVMQENNSSGLILGKQYLPMKYNQPTIVLDNNDLGFSLQLPPNTILVSGQGSYSYTPSSSTWGATSKSKTLYVTWSGTQYTISFEYKDESDQLVNIASGQISQQAVREGFDFNYDITPALPTDSHTTRYKGFKIDNGPLTSGTQLSINDVTSNVIVTLVYEILNPITITFDYGGNGAADTTESILPGDSVTTIPTPTWSGYSFKGWYDAATDGNLIDLTTATFDVTTTLYAQWAEITHVVTFYRNYDSSDTTEISSSAQQEAASLTLPTQPTRTGYTFMGWFDARTGGSEWTTANTVPNASLALYAQWAEITHVVTFFQNHNTSDTTELLSGSQQEAASLTLPTQPTRTGYTFMGWFDARTGGSEWTTANTVPNANLALYAQWAEITHLVTFYRNYDSSDTTEISSSAQQEAASLTLPTQPTRTGYTFMGWFDARTGGTQWTTANTVPNANLALYAQWAEITHVVTFFQNHNTSDTTELLSGSQQEGAILTLPTQPTRTGYTFMGWFDARTGGTQWTTANTVPNANLALYAQWAEITHVVTFFQNHNTSDTTELLSGSQQEGAILTLPTQPTRTGYTFMGWFDARTGGSEWTTANTVPNANLELYAQWAEITHVVTFFQNHNTSDTTELLSGSQQEGAILTLPTQPTRTGYTFMGWFDARMGGTQWTTANTVPNANLELYAQWAEITHVVTFFQNHNTSDTTELLSGSQQEAASLTLPTQPTRTGYTFMGWFDARTGGSEWTTANTVPNANLALYAQWAEITHVVTFFQNHNTSDTTELLSGSQQEGAILTLPTQPTRTGYTFMGWFDARTGGSEWSTANTVPNANLALYAQWAEITHVVTFFQNHNTSDTTELLSGSQQEGAILTLPTQPTRTGYTFMGWFDARMGGSEWTTANTVPNANLALYAQWAEITHVVTFFQNHNTSDTTELLSGSQQEGAILTLPTQPTRTGYTFMGWFDARTGGSEWSTANIVPNANLALYAQWAEITHVVTFFQNHNTSDTTQLLSGSQQEGAILTLPTQPTRTGYTFMGWFDARTGGTQWSTANTVPNANLELYAQWIQDNNTSILITLKYGNGDSDSIISIEPGNLVNPIANPTRIGYLFKGWYDAEIAGNEIDLTTKVFTANTILYAKWEPLNNAPTITIDDTNLTILQDGTGKTLLTVADIDIPHTPDTLSISMETSNPDIIPSAGVRMISTNIPGVFELFITPTKLKHTDGGSDVVLTFKVLDPLGAEATTTLTISVTKKNTPPTTSDLFFIVLPNTNVEGNVSGKDTDGDVLNFSIDSLDCQNGIFIPDIHFIDNGKFTYISYGPLNYSDTRNDLVKVRVSDNKGGTVICNINISGSKTPIQVEELEDGGTFVIPISKFTSPPSIESTSIDNSLIDPSSIRCEVLGDGTVKVNYTPNPYSFGDTELKVTISGIEYTIPIKIKPVDNVPVLSLTTTSPQAFSIMAASLQSQSQQVVGYVVPDDSNDKTYAATRFIYEIDMLNDKPKHGTVTIDQHGKYTYTPTDNTITSDTFWVTVWEENNDYIDNPIIPERLPDDVLVDADAYNLGAKIQVNISLVGTSYSVTYHSNGATSGSVPTTSSYNTGEIVTVEPVGNLFRNSYIFTGWNTEINGSGQHYVAGNYFTIGSSNIDLYAQWKYDSNNSTDEPSDSHEDDETETSNTTTMTIPRGYANIDKESNNKYDYHKKYVNGYPDGTFRMENPITRAEAAMIFYNLLVDSTNVNQDITKKYSDVDVDEWYAKAIMYLSGKGILTGYEDGTFKPNNYISRAEFVTLLVKFSNLEPETNKDTISRFTDIKEHWAYGYILRAHMNSWISGYKNSDLFMPSNNIKRSEVVTLVNKMLNRRLKTEDIDNKLNKYWDLTKDYWAYADIIEASYNHEYHLSDNYEVWITITN